MSHTALPQLAPRDFASDQEVRWCPGCGDFAVLNAITKALAFLGLPREETALITGIGCSSRIAAYTSLYGFHGVHGRALALAAGAAAAGPALTRWPRPPRTPARRRRPRPGGPE